MDNNDFDEEKFYKYLDFGHENEDFTISSTPQEIAALILPLMTMQRTR